MIKHFNDIMKEDRRLLVVSLPENSFEFAKIAVESGADAVKIHVNVKHRVTKIMHSSWNEVKDEALKIINELNVPVGVVPGEDFMDKPEQMEDIYNSGISFFDAYIENIPLWMKDTKLSKMFALNYNWDLNCLKYFESNGADSVEMSIVNPQDYGKRLSVKDLINYREIIRNTTLPTFVPTQKNIRPEEVKELLSIGLKGIIIGAIVTGSELDRYGEKIAYFAKQFREFNSEN